MIAGTLWLQSILKFMKVNVTFNDLIFEFSFSSRCGKIRVKYFEETKTIRRFIASRVLNTVEFW